MIVAVPDDRIAPWLTLHPPWVCLAHPLLCSTKRQKICTPYTARVCICIGITSTFQLALTKKMQAKIPHFGAGSLHIKQEIKKNQKQ